MELATQEPGMVANFDDFDVGPVRGFTRDLQPVGYQRGFVFAVELIPVAVTFGNFKLSIGPMGTRARLQPRRPGTQPHGAAQFVDASQFAQLVDHAVRRGRIEFGTVGPLEPAYVARVFNHRALHPQTDAKERDLLSAGVGNAAQHSGNAALTEPARHQDPVKTLELSFPSLAFEALRLKPDHIHANAIGNAAVHQRFVQALVGILELNILADNCN